MKNLQNNLKKIKGRELSESGFTLIELLVVILIIGILVSVAVPVFLNQRKKASEASVQSDLKNASIAMETELTANKGVYPGSLPDSVKTSSGVKLNLTVAGGPVDQKVTDGWNKVKLKAHNIGTQPDTYIYMRVVNSALYAETTDLHFQSKSYKGQWEYKVTCEDGTNKYSNGIHDLIQGKPMGWHSSICPYPVKVVSVTVLPLIAGHLPGYTVTEDITLYPTGSPLNVQPTTGNSSYCIDGYHENNASKFWKYDSINGGLQEGKCS